MTQAKSRPTLDPRLSLADAAAQLGLSTRTITRLAQRGELHAVHIGKKLIRYRTSDIMRIQQNGAP